MHAKNYTRYVICYPGGSGGSFLAAALDHAINNAVFNINLPLGHCHNNANRLNNIWFQHGESTESARQELDVIESLTFEPLVFEGHFRNLVAIKERISNILGYQAVGQTKFIKISVDPTNCKEILFASKMMQRKNNRDPETQSTNRLTQDTNYIKSWYWVENSYTTPQTITLTLSDIFLNKVSSKLDLPATVSDKLDQAQLKYVTVQQLLHQDLLDLLHA